MGVRSFEDPDPSNSVSVALTVETENADRRHQSGAALPPHSFFFLNIRRVAFTVPSRTAGLQQESQLASAKQLAQLEHQTCKQLLALGPQPDTWSLDLQGYRMGFVLDSRQFMEFYQLCGPTQIGFEWPVLSLFCPYRAAAESTP